MPKFLTTQQMGSAIEALRQSYKVMAPVSKLMRTTQ